MLEGNDRLGGRLFTLDDLPGRPDAGGIQVGAGYRRFHEIADRLGVKRYVPQPSSDGSLYHIRGESLTTVQWPNASVNRLAFEERQTPSDALFFRYLVNLPKLENVSDWMLPDNPAGFISIRDFRPNKAPLQRRCASSRSNLNSNSIETLSALHMARSLAIFRKSSGPTQHVEGGSQRMTDAMANALHGDVILNSKVIAIEDGAMAWKSACLTGANLARAMLSIRSRLPPCRMSRSRQNCPPLSAI